MFLKHFLTKWSIVGKAYWDRETGKPDYRLHFV
jgi:hypothetical protein